MQHTHSFFSFLQNKNSRIVILRAAQVCTISGAIGVFGIGYLAIRSSAQEYVETQSQSGVGVDEHNSTTSQVDSSSVSSSSATSLTIPESVNASEQSIVVSVVGLVQKPGVYTLPKKSRVIDLVRNAGGFLPEFSLEDHGTGINFAAELSDGQQVVVQSGAVEGGVNTTTSTDSNTIGSSSSSVGKISLNTATAAQLDELEGIGEVRAEKIIANRPYAQLEDVVTKDVLTQNQFEAIKEKVSL